VNIIDELIGHSDRERFWQQTWTHKPAHFPGAAVGLRQYLDRDDLPAIAAAGFEEGFPRVMVDEHGRMHHGKFQAVADAVKEPETTVSDLIDVCDGATLVVNGVARMHEGIAKLQRALFTAFEEHITINGYYSPPSGTAGLGLHFDRWDIFAVHLRGAKRWRIYPPTQVDPVQATFKEKPTPDEDEPLFEGIVRGGDVMYIPRGFWHLVEPTDEECLHLTLGVHVKKGIDVAQWLFNETSKADSMRRNMPLTCFPGGAKQQLDAVAEAVEEVRAMINDDAAVKNFLRYRFMHEHELTWSFKFSAL